MSGLRVPAAALLRAVERNAITFPMLPHQREATTALAFDLVNRSTSRECSSRGQGFAGSCRALR